MTTVGAAVRMWRTKQSERRATIASESLLTGIPRENSFALKLNNVLGERF